MSARAGTVRYPAGGWGPPKDRQDHDSNGTGLPAGTEVFSADDHISLAEDIFFERFPDSMRDQAPRVFAYDGVWTLGFGDKTFLPREFNAVLMQYDPLDGATTRDIDARIRELESDGIHTELAFPNAVLALLAWPDKVVRELCFRIYQRVHRGAAGAVERSLLRRRAHQLLGRRRRRPHARGTEGARPQDVPAAAEAGQGRRGPSH